MILIERRQIVAMAATEGGVLLEQPLLDVETKVLGLVVQGPLALLFRELVHLAVGIEHVEQGLALHFRHLGNQLSRPHLFHGEAFGELHQLPQVGLGPFRCLHLLVPELGATFGVAVGPSFSTHMAVGRMRSAAWAVTVG